MLVKWILVNNCKVSSLLHYLDDFITAAPPPLPTPLSVHRTSVLRYWFVTIWAYILTPASAWGLL